MKTKNLKENKGIIISLKNEKYIPDLFGEYDGNLMRIEKILGVNIKGRGNIIEVSGEKSKFAKNVINDLYFQLIKGSKIGIEEVDAAIRMNGMNNKIDENKTIDFIIKTVKKNIRPRTHAQINYVEI